MVNNRKGSVCNILGTRKTRRPVRQDIVHNQDGPSQFPVLQWKLDIQHYDAQIEHVPGVMNTPADVFIRLVEKDAIAEVNHVMALTCSLAQRDTDQS